VAAGGEAVRGALAVVGRNPASESRLQFTVGRTARVSLKVYDLQGRAVRTLIEQDAAPGTFRTTWDGRDDQGRAAGKGVYFVRFATDGQVAESRKIQLR
jgi:flagellar hook assembly protein FlgD